MALFNNPKEIFFKDYNNNNIYINGLLLNVPGYEAPRSLTNSEKLVTYDYYYAQLNKNYISGLIKDLLDPQVLDTCKGINKTLIFSLQNLRQVPSTMRNYIYDVILVYVEFLKIAVDYPKEDVVSDQITSYLPILKEISIALRDFLSNNK